MPEDLNKYLSFTSQQSRPDHQAIHWNLHLLRSSIRHYQLDRLTRLLQSGVSLSARSTCQAHRRGASLMVFPYEWNSGVDIDVFNKIYIFRCPVRSWNLSESAAGIVTRHQNDKYCTNK